VNFLIDKPITTLFSFLAERTGVMWTPDFQALGRVVDGKLIGVIGFNNFNGASCHIHMAGDGGRWMSRAMLETAARYVFYSCKLEMMFGLVPSGNKAALEQDLRMGFTQLIAIPHAHPDGALHILQMTRAQCRWLKRKKYGQEIHSAAA
jgi:hypothetical protein